MKLQLTLATLALSLVGSVVAAGPRVLEEQGRIVLPDPSSPFADVAVDGDNILALSFLPLNDPARPSVSGEDVAFLYQLTSTGSWQLVRELFRLEVPHFQSRFRALALRDGVAAIVRGPDLHVFERTSTGWVAAPIMGGVDGVDVKVHSGMILATYGACGYDANLFRKNASGAWSIAQTFRGQAKPGCDTSSRGGLLDLTNNRALLTAPGELHIWNRNTDGSWPVLATAVVPMIDSGGNPYAAVAIEGDTVIRAGQIYRNNGGWGYAGSLHRPDSAMVGFPSGVEMLNGLVPIGYPIDPARVEGAGAVALYQRDASGSFSYTAKLVASDATASALLGAIVDMSGRRVVTTARPHQSESPYDKNTIYVFDLPASLSQPALVQEDFEDGNAFGWSTLAGSAFSVVSSGGSRVYRQSSTTGDAAATRSGMDWTNQSIETVVTPRAFASTGEKWFGLTVRQTDPGNFYYLTVRSTNRVELRSLRNGVISVLWSTEIPVTLNRPYWLRLEAVGTWLRVYVDGQLMWQVSDSVHTHGSAGIRTYKAAADFDNIVISPTSQTTLLIDRFDMPDHPIVWTARQGQWVQPTESSPLMSQTSLGGDGRLTASETADDQVVTARARANTFAPGGERWFGLMARFQDERNFYYVTVRNVGTVSLRKVVNGTIYILDTASLPVTTGRWYSLRLEAVGNLLRVYVDGRLLVEAADSSHARGTYGLATYRTAADFDDVVVTQP